MHDQYEAFFQRKAGKAQNYVAAAVAVVLMLMEFPIPFLIPDFVKMDFSELPALLAAFSLGPVYGVAVCFIKNAVHAFFTTTGCIGELSNFLLGCCFVIPAGILYNRKKNRKNALLGAFPYPGCKRGACRCRSGYAGGDGGEFFQNGIQRGDD